MITKSFEKLKFKTYAPQGKGELISITQNHISFYTGFMKENNLRKSKSVDLYRGVETIPITPSDWEQDHYLIFKFYTTDEGMLPFKYLKKKVQYHFVYHKQFFKERGLNPDPCTGKYECFKFSHKRHGEMFIMSLIDKK